MRANRVRELLVRHRASHETWANARARGLDKDNPDVGDEAFHRQVMAEYDAVIADMDFIRRHADERIAELEKEVAAERLLRYKTQVRIASLERVVEAAKAALETIADDGQHMHDGGHCAHNPENHKLSRCQVIEIARQALASLEKGASDAG